MRYAHVEANAVTLRRETGGADMHGRIIRFDPQRRASSADLKTAIRALADSLEASEWGLGLRTRRRRENDRARFRLAVEALSCNLLVAAMVRLGTPLAVPREHRMMWGKSRYVSPVYGQHFIAAIDLIAHSGEGDHGFRRMATTCSGR